MLKVTIFMPKFEKNLCGGSIYSKNVAITSALCCHENELLKNSVVMAGAVNLTEFDENSANIQFSSISTYLVHPNYSAVTHEHDICLVYLENELNLTGPFVKSIKLASDDPDPQAICETSGWGPNQVRLRRLIKKLPCCH